MKFKFGIKQIVLSVVAVLLIVIMAVGNYYLSVFAHVLHEVFGGKGTVAGGKKGGTQEGESAFEYADRVIQETAEDSIVLLKNDEVDGQPYLPRPITTTFNLFGYGATDHGFLLVGGGSGGTNITADKKIETDEDGNPSGREVRVTLAGAFDKTDIAYNHDLLKAYTDLYQGENGNTYIDSDYRNGGSTSVKNGYLAASNPGADFYSQHASLIDSARATSADAVAVLCRWGNENGGEGELKNIDSYSNGAMLELTANEKLMFDTLQSKGFNVTVLLNTTNPIEMGFLDDYPCIKAVMYVGIPGQSGAMAIPNLLVGSKLAVDEEGTEETVYLSPSGKLADTFANDWQSNAPSYQNVGRGGNVAYQEGIYVGYKWYETAAEEGVFNYDEVVRYPFGYGLSYTTFSQEITSFEHDGDIVGRGAEIIGDGTYTMTVKVKNTGNYPGREVVQLYYTPEYYDGGIEKASVNLLAFAKTDVLQPAGAADGADEQEVTLTFDAYDMASYDDYDKNNNGFKGYEIDKGQYDIKLMWNAHDAIENQSYSLHSTNGIKIANDPFTGNEVKNLFTGDDAYADMPIDGSKGLNSAVEYLSRKDGFANFSNMKAVSATNSAASQAAGFTYHGDDDKADEVASYGYGMDASVYITSNSETGEKPTMADLTGDTGVTLNVDQSILSLLIGEDDADIWTMFLDQVTKDEINTLFSDGYFSTKPIESVGKPRNADKDGPAGFNKNVTAANVMNDYPVLPAETLSGCSWDIDMMREIGRAQGEVAKVAAEPVQGWYAPGVNLHRSPYNSRNYEYFSEDGVLSGWLAAGIINGAKEKNLYCYLKHFALAESGENSKDWYEWSTEQTLREIYCKPFEIAVKVSIDPGVDDYDTHMGELAKNVKVVYDVDAEKLRRDDANGRPQPGANAMMSAFNKIGAVWSGYNHALLTDMLREEWGFRGSVITDWHEPKDYMSDVGRALRAGNDLWLGTVSASVNFNDVGEAYGARQSLKGILYTYLDTLYVSGTESTAVARAPYSTLFVTLWALIDVALGLGIVACGVFFFWSPLKNRKAKKALAEGAEGAEEPSDEGTDEPLQETAESDPPTPPDEA